MPGASDEGNDGEGGEGGDGEGGPGDDIFDAPADADAYDADGEVAPLPKKPRKNRSRLEKNRACFNHRRELRPSRTVALTTNGPSSASHAAHMLKADREGRLANMATSPCPNCGDCNFIHKPTSKSTRVHVFTDLGYYPMDVPEQSCLHGHVWTPDAEAASCFAAQAKKSRGGSTWFALSLLQRADQFLFHGSAFKVLAGACGASYERLIPAWFEWKMASAPQRDLAVLGVTGVDTGPLRQNPSLADLKYALGPEPEEAGPQRDAYLNTLKRLKLTISLATDATRTVDLLPNVGKASLGLPSILKGPYLSDAMHTEWNEIAAARVGKSPIDGDGEDATICGDISYKCARPRANQDGKKQSDGLAGVVDEDGIPVERSFVCLGKSKECFPVFDLILLHTLETCKDVVYVIVDHGCKYGPHLLQLLTPEQRARVKVILPWMHAELHILSCRLLHSGMYVEGIGYIVGEMTEQLWNQLKPFAKNIRYMRWGNHVDFLNLGLQWIVDRKVAGLFKASSVVGPSFSHSPPPPSPLPPYECECSLAPPPLSPPLA